MKEFSKKALIIDSSGVHPWLFAVKEGGISPEKFEEFFNDIGGVDCHLSNQARHEFSTLEYASGVSLFAEPIQFVGEQGYDEVYLSDAGYFSVTTNANLGLRLSVSDSGTEPSHSTLWETSSQWQSMSREDRSVMKLSRELTSQYSSVAILTNDWALRQQSTLYEGIEARGTCSMLAGFVLSGYINYQRGTSIFGQWLTQESRWVPTYYPERRKFTFREVLEVERNLRTKDKSFWAPKKKLPK